MTPGTEIEALWERGDYQPYTEDELIDLVAYAKSLLPRASGSSASSGYPGKADHRGPRHSNFRQAAGSATREQEAGAGASGAVRQGGRPLRKRRLSRPWPIVHAAGRSGSYRQAQSTLIGFARLRFPQQPFREELTDAALLRELHVYGSLVPISAPASPEEWQHRSYGAQLLSRAEEEARDHGYRRLAVMSGVGVRPYYRKQGYERVGPYMIKTLP